MLSLIVLFVSAFAHAGIPNDVFRQENLFYTAVDSTEAIVEYSHWVEFEGNSEPSKWRMQTQVEQQLAHLFGPLGAAEFSAVPKTDHVVRDLKLEKISNRIYRIHYSYKGHFVIRTGIDNVIPLVLPNNPDKIYRAGMVGRHNPCTDDHYQSEGDFWYFWNPEQPNCPLKEGRDYTVVEAQASRILNTKTTYPEYEKLVNAEKTIDVALYFGMDKPEIEPNPYTSKDINADNFLRTQRSLLKLGFKSVKTEKDRIYYREFFEKQYSPSQTLKKIIVKVYFGPTGISEDSSHFHSFLKQTFENESMMIYDGHSGLGGHLDLDAIEVSLGQPIQFPMEKYQILFFNSCSSYPYYNTQYFARKMTDEDPRGSKNLDILTNGLATYFHTIANSNFVLLSALDQYAKSGLRTSYQKLAQEIDSDNLFGVNGDEDNPKQ